MKKDKIAKLFNPKSIAVVGASDREGSVGNALISNLIYSKYAGKVYPINPKHDKIQGKRAYPTVGSIPEKIDLVIIATPAPTVPKIVEECGLAGVSGVIIISSGFSEMGEEGRKASGQIKKTAEKYDMRIIGPNCLGFIRPSLNLNASFTDQMALPGRVAFISQSGALCSSMLDWSIKNNVGFSHFISIGSAVDVEFNDLIDYLGNDSKTDSILIYMESLQNAEKFIKVARNVCLKKPVVVLKVGRTDEGAQAAKSHTGSLAGNDSAYEAGFERAGVIRIDTINSLFNVAKTLAMQEVPKGDRVAVVTNAGGPGVIATDYLVSRKCKLAKLDKDTIKKLDKFLPPAWSHANPVDILGDGGPERYREAIKLCLADKNVDAILIILTPQSMTNPTGVAEEIVNIKNPKNKTIMTSFMGGDDVLPAIELLEKGNIPTYRSPEDAINTFAFVHQQVDNLKFLKQKTKKIPRAFNPKIKQNRKIIDTVIKDKRLVLTEEESKKVLANYDIPIAKHYVAQSPKEAGKLAKKLGFPVAMKILSPDIIHKTDVGGVELNIESIEKAQKAYNRIIRNAKKHNKKARIKGVFMEKMENKKYELLIGCKKDKTFGPMIVFGQGGVAVEVLKDTKAGLAPLNMSLAQKMIEDTKICKLLKGYRNMPSVDILELQFLLYKFSCLITDFPEIKELDINPFAIDDKGGLALDAKVILDEEVINKFLKK